MDLGVVIERRLVVMLTTFRESAPAEPGSRTSLYSLRSADSAAAFSVASRSLAGSSAYP